MLIEYLPKKVQEEIIDEFELNELLLQIEEEIKQKQDEKFWSLLSDSTIEFLEQTEQKDKI